MDCKLCLAIVTYIHIKMWNTKDSLLHFFLENFSLAVFILSEDREEMKQKSY